jgi:hypothetical protein
MSDHEDTDGPSDKEGLIVLLAVMVLLVTVAYLVKHFLA